MKRPETDSPGEMHFHYNREEREAGLSEFTKRNLHTKGFFKRNRSLAITLADLSVLVLLFFIIYFYIRMSASPLDVEGLSVDASAYRVDGSVYVTLTFERVADSGPEGVVTVFLRALPVDVRVKESDYLPAEIGKKRIIRSVIVTSEPDVTIYATVEYSTTSKVIQIDVKERSQ